MRTNSDIARSRFWGTLIGYLVLSALAFGICLPIALFGIVPLFDWLDTGSWVWPRMDTLVYAAKFSIVPIFLVGLGSWVRDKYGQWAKRHQGND